MKRLVAPLVLLLAVLALATPAASAGEIHALNQMRSAQALNDQQLNDISIMLLVLGETAEVQSLDWNTMLPVIAALQGSLPQTLVWFALPDGSYYTVDGGLMEQNLADRAYFEPLMAGREVIGDIIIGKSSGRWSAVVAEPIVRGGRVVGALGVSVFIDEMAERTSSSIGWPFDDFGLKVLDANGDEIYTNGDYVAEVGVELVSDATGWTYILLAKEQPSAE